MSREPMIRPDRTILVGNSYIVDRDRGEATVGRHRLRARSDGETGAAARIADVQKMGGQMSM